MSLDNSLPDGLLAAESPHVIPPLGEQGTPTPSSGPTRRPLFASDGSHRALRSQPTPPTGPPPSLALKSPGRNPPSLANVLDMRLPGISPRGADARPDLPSQPPVSDHLEKSNFRDINDGSLSADEKDVQASSRNDDKGEQGVKSRQTLVALAEGQESEQLGRDSAEQQRLSAGIDLAARKAKRVAEVRTIAQEVGRGAENDGKTKADGAEREEIERALAAVDETRRKRMERQQTGGAAAQQDEEKLRRRQVKRERLMKKRKEMEERLEEEASKMAELTENAKKKGESKFMSEEAKREAEKRIRAEAEVVIQLERQAAQMAAQREQMQKNLAEHEDEKDAEIEANSSALKTKRALVEAQMKQEEEDIKSLSEAARREVEAKMVAEAAAIADMERQALEMSAKRAELEAEMSNRLRLEDTLVQESQEISRKREEMEAKMQQDEAELQKLSDEAKRRVLEKMAAEAAAIAEMERQASQLAEERAALASQVANQHTSAALQDEESVAVTVSVDADDGGATHVSAALQDEEPVALTVSVHADDGGAAHIASGDEVDATGVAEQYIQRHHEHDAARPFASGIVGETAANEDIEGTPNTLDSGLGQSATNPGLDNLNAALTPSFMPLDERASNEEQETLSSNTEDVAAEASQWAEHDIALDTTVFSNVCTECDTQQRDMSSAHLAAAAGHVACLEAIQVGNSPLMVKLDSAGRSPLFYACANAHADAADLLIRDGPQCCHAMDINRDTPLHAAALAGSGLCCRLLLQQGRSEVEPLNAMQMTPAHLAANNDVLEVLSQHGANLNAKDVDLRTPLFVACATDRLEKAEFLCELLECGGQDLGEADKRGDTPMHAAAHNGSTACLLLLLQYGVAPDVRNLKGLRPIDLASRRGQSACEKILMEYQLHHHVNNSYFDSVLFLATLEGHKKCKEVLTDHKRQDNAKTDAPTNSPLARPESLYSLRHGRSVRLEHWGDWIAYQDQNNAESVFWYNHVAQKSQWDAPIGVREAREASRKGLANSSMRLKREGDWIQYTLPDGNVFYYNDKSNEFQWERPDQLSSRAVSEDWPEEGLEDDTAETADAIQGDWGAFKDPSTGLVFWYNHVTGESQWEPPDEVSTAEEGQNDTASPKQGDLPAPDEAVREINSVDELFTPR